ncbi:MAG: cohesin domain-containing protein [Ferruginibacter sp.]
MKLVLKISWAVFLLLVVMNGVNAQQTLFIDKQEYSCAPAFDIAVRTKGISKVVALQGTVTWDTAIVKFNSISYGSGAIAFNSGNVNVAASANGYLTFLWVENNLQGQSTPDNAALFTINFLSKASGKGKGAIAFASVPTSLEIDTLDVNGLPAVNQGAVFTGGYIVTPYVYNFTGAGNWDIAANWKDNAIPPAVLPTCSEIVINPSGTNESVLNVPQTISSGAKMTVIAGKKLRVPGNLILQ